MSLVPTASEFDCLHPEVPTVGGPSKDGRRFGVWLLPLVLYWLRAMSVLNAFWNDEISWRIVWRDEKRNAS
jgi:hypothetical protein